MFETRLLFPEQDQDKEKPGRAGKDREASGRDG